MVAADTGPDYVVMFRLATLVAAFSALPALAGTFGLDFAWTPVAGLNGNSGDQFEFRFYDPSGQLKITELTVTLGSGLVYDLSNSGPGYLTWGPYAIVQDDPGSTMTGAPLGEGAAGNKTATWTFANFDIGSKFIFSADVDKDIVCGNASCKINADYVSAEDFIARGAVAVAFTVDFGDGGPTETFSFSGLDPNWSVYDSRATTNFYPGYTRDGQVPEPGTWLMAAGGGLALLAFRRRAR